jgi:hypothetical protein
MTRWVALVLLIIAGCANEGTSGDDAGVADGGIPDAGVDEAVVLCAPTVDTCGREEDRAACPPAPPVHRAACDSERVACPYCVPAALERPTIAFTCDLGIWLFDNEACIP